MRKLGIENLNLSPLNPNRRKILAREARRLYPTHLRRFPAPRRYALLVCLLSEMLSGFNDQAVETYDQILREMQNRSQGRQKKELFERRQTITTHLQLLRRIGQTVLDQQIADAELRPAIFKIISRKKLDQAIQDCEELAQTEETDNVLTRLRNNYSPIRRFSPRLLAILKLQTTASGQPLFQAVAYLRRLDSGEQTDFTHPPVDFIPAHLRKTIIAENGQIDRRYWELALHDRLARALRSGDIWVEHSTDHAPLSHDLQVSPETRATFLKNNPHLKDGERFLQGQHTLYLETLKRANGLWPDLEDVRFENGLLIVSPLKALEEPAGTEAARQQLYARLPHRQLAQVFREVLHWVDYLAPLREAAGDDVRVANLDERLLAVLMAEGCNLGVDNLAEAAPGLTYMQLAHTAGRCLETTALEQAIALVIKLYDRQPIAHVWGEGTWSSADGQLVPTPVKSLYARLHPRAPKGKRMINLMTYVYDRLMPYWGRVIGTTAHESANEIDGLLHNEADLHPRHQATDNAGYTDNVFGLASLLSIFYAPRIKGLADQRLFYFDPADPKTFEHVGRLLVEKIDVQLIKIHWDQLLDLAAAVEQGLAPAARILRKLEASGEHHDLYRALQALGRIAKTIYIIHFLTDPELRRQVERQLNKTESYNSLADIIWWGRKGEMREPDLTHQLNQASCLRLIAAIIILFNAAYIQRAVRETDGADRLATDDQLSHIFPTQTRHIRFLGDYSFQDEPESATQIDDLPRVMPQAALSL